MIVKIAILIATIAALSSTAISATCTYYRNSNRVRCGSVTCDTVSHVPGGKPPKGDYRIGTFYYHSGREYTPWFNLYKETAYSEYWDYHTKIPDLNCRGGFGLHPGTRSTGSIVVTRRSCFDRIKSILIGYSTKTFSVKECRKCFFWNCLLGIRTVSSPRYFLTDLTVKD